MTYRTNCWLSAALSCWCSLCPTKSAASFRVAASSGGDSTRISGVCSPNRSVMVCQHQHRYQSLPAFLPDGCRIPSNIKSCPSDVSWDAKSDCSALPYSPKTLISSSAVLPSSWYSASPSLCAIKRRAELGDRVGGCDLAFCSVWGRYIWALGVAEAHTRTLAQRSWSRIFMIDVLDCFGRLLLIPS